MYNKIFKWLDNVLQSNTDYDCVAFCFNLYEDEDNTWSMELVATESFDNEDDDWTCDELTDFNTRDNPYIWHKESCWNEIQEEMILILKKYLKNGKYAYVLKEKEAVAVGFVDGNIECIYIK